MIATWLFYHFTSVLARQYRRVKELSTIDALTEVFNRRALNEKLVEFIQCNNRYIDRRVCLAIVDLDHSKRINDEFGHLVGDEVLKVFCQALQSRLRSTDIITRFGGEEFALIFPETTPEQADQVLNKVRARLERNPFRKNVIRFNSGICGLIENDTLEHCLSRCDDALYQAKKEGRNRNIIAS